MPHIRTSRFVASAVVSVCGLAPQALADIAGFNGLAGWRLNVGDGASPPTYNPGTDTLHLTNSGAGEFRSVFFETPQAIGQFSASFTYTAANVASAFGNPFGACFVIQNSPAGAGALGGFNGGLGYSGITNSVALSFEIGSPPSRSGLYTGGVVGGGASPTTPVNLLLGNPIDVDLSYNGSLLAVTLTDTVTLAQYQTAYPINIPAMIGGPTAYIGFSASTHGVGNADQYIGHPDFSVPGPAGLSLMGLAGIMGMRRRRVKALATA